MARHKAQQTQTPARHASSSKNAVNNMCLTDNIVPTCGNGQEYSHLLSCKKITFSGPQFVITQKRNSLDVEVSFLSGELYALLRNSNYKLGRKTK